MLWHFSPLILPGWHLISHHDLVISIGHEQPEGLLENIFDEMLSIPMAWDLGLRLTTFRASFASRLGIGLGVMLQGVNTTEVFAGVAAPYTQF